jgi:hypothetical protein
MRTRRAAHIAPSCRSACPAALEARSGLKSALLVALAALVQVLSVSAQSYSIGWFTIAGGGGTSTGSVYAVRVTIGQPDASATTMTGGNYSLTGGFWSAVAIQTPGAPTLSIVPGGLGQARVTWTPDVPGWVLQETPSLAPAAWGNSPSGSTNPALVPAGPPMKFYRLFKP